MPVPKKYSINPLLEEEEELNPQEEDKKKKREHNKHSINPDLTEEEEGNKNPSLNPELTEEERRESYSIDPALTEPPTATPLETPAPTVPPAPAPTQPTPLETPAPTAPTEPEENPYAQLKSQGGGAVYDYLDKLIKENEPESKEERLARERRERSRAIVNSIADVGRTLGNLYYTTQYAPNAYDESKHSLSEIYQKKLDKAKAEREKQKEQWLSYVMTKKKLEDADRAQHLAVINSEEANKIATNKLALQIEQSEEKLSIMREKLDLQKEKVKNAKDAKERELAIKEAEQNLKQQKLEIERMYKSGLLSNAQYNLRIKETENEMKSLGKTTIETKTDQMGGVTTTEKTTRPAASGGTGTNIRPW